MDIKKKKEREKKVGQNVNGRILRKYVKNQLKNQFSFKEKKQKKKKIDCEELAMYRKTIYHLCQHL